LALVQVGDNAIKPTANLGDFAIIDQTDKNPQHAGLFAIDGSDHIKLRFLEHHIRMPIRYLSVTPRMIKGALP
jgi:hypothetical protein